MTYSRPLSSDSELIGPARLRRQHFRRIIAPAVVLSLLVTGLTFVFNELITPARENYRARPLPWKRALDSERPTHFKSRAISSIKSFSAGPRDDLG